MRDDHLPGVLAYQKRDDNVSLTVVRNQLNTRHPTATSLAGRGDRDPDQG
ncbi:MAG TPA: hypothetical protein VFM55_09050 [Micromonosporaceae bacterium]|nr:hypothetical protein [Micromonosporaceae bacterium]